MALTRPSAAQLRSTTIDFSDPLVRINKNQTGVNSNDIGIIFERGSDTNVAFIWDESEDQFGLINTTETGTTNGNVTVSSYANIKANAFYGDGSNLTGIDAAVYGDSDVASYLSTNGYDTSVNIIASITDSAPSTLDTLNELAAALGDDANFSTTVTNSIATKLPLAGGTMSGDLALGSNDITGVSLLRIDQTGTGLRMTNVGAFDNDGSDNFRVFATNSLQLKANGDNGSGLSIDATNNDVTVDNNLIVNGTLYSTANETVATTSSTVIYDFLHATYGSAEFVITAVNGTNRHITKLLVTHNGTTAVATEYGSVFTGNSLASYDVSIVGSSTQLLATPTNTSTTFKIVATLIE